MNAIARAIGFRFFERAGRGERWELRLSWAEITGSFGFALGLCLFEEHYSLHIHLGWPNIYLRLPFLQRWHHDPHEMMESWSIALHRYDAHLNWGRRCKIIHWPWDWDWVRTSLMLADGTWIHETNNRKVDFPNYPLSSHEKKPWGTWYKIKEELAWTETYPYRYALRNCTVQDRLATCKVEEREWRWRWFKWLPFPRMIQRTIAVDFNEEVGERSGSWKGGCAGCGYNMRFDEMPVEALKRMELERKF